MDKRTRPILHFVGIGDQPRSLVPPHHHRSWMLILYTLGQGELRSAGIALPFRPGIVHAVPPGRVYSGHGDGGFISLYAAVDGVRLDPDRIHQRDAREDPRLEWAARLLLEEFRQQDDGWEIACQQALELYLRRFTDQSTETGDPLAQRLRQLIGQRYADPGFTVAQATALYGSSLRQVRAAYQRTYGITPLQALTRRRIDAAERLLARGLSVGTVAEQVGFADPFYFSRKFRALTGRSPKASRPG